MRDYFYKYYPGYADSRDKSLILFHNFPKFALADSGKPLGFPNSRRERYYEHLTSVRFSSNDKMMAGGSLYFPDIFIWNLETGRIINVFQTKTPVVHIDWSHSTNLLSACTQDNVVTIYNVQNGLIFKKFTQHEGLRQGVFSPDGLTLLTSDKDSIKIWNIFAGELKNVIKSEEENLYYFSSSNVVFSPSGFHFAFSDGFNIQIRETLTGALTAKISTYNIKSLLFHVTSLAWSPNSFYIVAGTNHYEAVYMKIYDIRTLDCILEIRDDSLKHACLYLKWFMDKTRNFIVSVCDNETIQILDLSKGIEAKFLTGHRSLKFIRKTDRRGFLTWSPGGIYDLDVSASGNYLFTSCIDKTMRLWSTDI